MSAARPVIVLTNIEHRLARAPSIWASDRPKPKSFLETPRLPVQRLVYYI